jgi:hypothetical protein
LRPSTCRPSLEGLEDRVTPSSATQVGSTLNIIASPGTASTVRPIVLQVDATDHTKIDVLDSGTLLGKFTIASIKNVNVTVAGNDAIKVNDSNGIPFASDPGQTFGTSISLTGSGTNNSLALVGSQPLTFNGNETYIGGNGTVSSALELGGLGAGAPVFGFSSAISSVTDDLTAGQLIVETQSQAVSLVGANGQSQTLKGLAGTGAGGSTLTFHGKGGIVLELESNNATATLNATAAAIGEQDFQVLVFGNTDHVNINATPRNVSTLVEVDGAFGGGQNDLVLVAGNSGAVQVQGDGSTIVDLGTSDTDTSVTSGINANVKVAAVNQLLILNGGNVSTLEQVRVTESTISGTGLFGNNAVTLTYEAVAEVDIFTGQDARYTVAASQPGATFGDLINILDESTKASLGVNVVLDSGSDLRLGVVNANPGPSDALSIDAVNGTFNPNPPTPTAGTEQVTFASGFTSLVFYNGFLSPILF